MFWRALARGRRQRRGDGGWSTDQEYGRKHIPRGTRRTRSFRHTYGGRYVAETLVPLVLQVEQAYVEAKADPSFAEEFAPSSANMWAGPARSISPRDSLRGWAARKFTSSATNSITPAHTRSTTRSARSCSPGEWVRRASSRRPARGSTASRRPLSARFRPEVRSVHGRYRHRAAVSNVFRMKLLGAEVRPVKSGAGTLKDAMNDALARLGRQRRRHLLSHRHGRGAAPIPPWYGIFSRSSAPKRASRSSKRRDVLQIRLSHASAAARTLLDCFFPFLDERANHYVEAAGHGVETGEHCASLTAGRPGVLHGNRT